MEVKEFTKAMLHQDTISLVAQILTDIPIRTRHTARLADIVFGYEDLIWAHMEQVRLENKEDTGQG